jgi:hypothetical protein
LTDGAFCRVSSFEFISRPIRLSRIRNSLRVKSWPNKLGASSTLH